MIKLDNQNYKVYPLKASNKVQRRLSNDEKVQLAIESEHPAKNYTTTYIYSPIKRKSPKDSKIELKELDTQSSGGKVDTFA